MTDRTQPPVDLRSDVFAAPTDAMWAAMREAEIGWAYFGQDRSVNRLEALAADLLGKEAAVFVATCTAANLAAIMTQAPRGSRVVMEASAHTATTEASGLAYVAGIVPHHVIGTRGVMAPEAVEAALRAPAGSSAARVSVVSLENSHNNAGGTVLTPETTDTLADLAHQHGAQVHLDGARLFNAAVELGVPVGRLALSADTVSINLNKGLGAPFGAILAGPAATIAEARASLHRLGVGSIHQLGILAAAGLVALSEGVERLADDHRRARALAERIAQVPGLAVDLTTVQTNIVVADVTRPDLDAEGLVTRLAEHGVLAYPRPPLRVRFVTHRGVGDAEIARAAAAVEAALR